MPAFVALSRETHAGKRFIPSNQYFHAAKDSVVRLVGAEFAKAATNMPIAFVPEDTASDSNKNFFPVAVLSLQQEENLFVGPNGQWLGQYVPALFRRYPFILAQTDKDNPDQLTLAIDEDANRLTDSPEGLSLFEEDGELSEHLRGVLDFLQQLETNTRATSQACQYLVKHDLLVPWQIAVAQEDGTKTPVNGLYCVDEGKLDALSDEAFLELRHSRALVIAQMQMFSMQKLSIFNVLARTKSQLAAQEKQKPKLDDMLDFGHGDDITFTF